MLDDAANSSLTEAVFNLTNPTFAGTLTINLPDNASAWTTRNIPLRVVIRNGTSGTSYPSTYILVGGVLALGSTITVTGGDYDFKGSFLHIPSGGSLTVQDGSAVAVKSATFPTTTLHLRPMLWTSRDP